MSTLEKLKQKINESTSGNALNELNKADFAHLSKSVDAIANRFTFLGNTAFKIKDRISDAFLGMAKTLATTVPNIIKEGGWTRAMNIEQAKFMLEGLDVAWKDIAEDINYAVADTAYGLDSAAKAASQLVASNVKVGDSMKTALRAISGVAAMTNSEYDDIANVFTKVAGNGRLMGDDLQRLSARGMNAAATLSDYFKGVMNGSIEASDSVKAHIATITAQFGYGEAAIRDMVSKGQIDFATFAEAMDTTFGEHAKDANRTFMGVTQNLQAALKKIGALFATPILEQDGPVVQALNKLKDRIDDVRNSLGPLTKVWTEFVYRYAHDAKVLLQNMDMSFMKNVAQGLTNIFKSLVSVVDAVRYGFADIFLDSKGVKGIGDMAKAFSDFTAKLTLSNSEMEDLRATIRGFLSVGDILVTIVKQILGAILRIKPESVNIREIILKITGTIGDLITYVAQLIKQTNIIEPAIKGISSILNVLISLAAIGIDRIIAFVSYISRLEIVPKIINGIETAVKVLLGGIALLISSVIRLFNGGVKELPNILHKISTGLGEIISWLSNIPIINSAIDAVKRLTDAFMNLINPKVKEDNGLVKTVTIVDDAVALAGPPIQKATKLEGAVNKLVVIKDKLVDFSKGIVTFVKNLDYGAIAAVAFTVAIAGIGYKLAQTMQAVSETFSATNNAINQVAGVIGSLKNRSIMELIFGKHEPKKQSHFLLEFAAAIVAVAGSLKLLSTINSNKLEEVGLMLGKVGLGVAGLVTLLTILQKVLGKGEALAISSVLFSISGSIALMVAALAAATAIDYTNIQKAGAAIFQLSLVISGMAIALSVLAPRISKGALSLIAMAWSIKILIGALDTLAHLQIEARLTQLGGRKLWAKGGALVVLASGLVLVSGIASKLGTNSLIGIVAALLSLKMIIPLANSLAKQIQNSVFAEIWNKMVEFFVNIKTNHPKIWAGALAFLAITGIILSIVGAIKLIGKAISSIGGVFTGMQKEVGKFAGLQKALSRLALVPVIVALTGMMVAIGVMAVVIGKIKLPYLSQAIWIMAAISGIFLALAAVVKASRESKPTAIIGAMVGITMLFSELIVLTLLVEKHWAGMLVACAMMATIMHEMSNVFDSIAEASETNAKTLVAIGMIAVIVAELGGIMYLLSQQDWKSVAASGAAMSASMIAFANMITTIGSTGQSFTKNKFLAIAECAAVLPIIGASLTLASLSHDWAAILAAGGAMSAVMVAFGAMMQIVGKTKWNAGAWAAIGAIAVSAIAIGAALSIATLSHDWEAIWAAGKAMSLVMGVFGGMAVLLGKMNIQSAATAFVALLSISLTATLIGAALTNLAKSPWQDILAAAGIMAGTIAVLSALAIGLGAIWEFSIPGAIALDLIAVSMLGLSTSASILLSALTAFLPVADAFIGSVLGTLVGYSEQLPSTALGLVELAGGLALVGAAGLALVLGAPGLISASIGLNLLVPACQGLNDVNLIPLAEGLAALVVPGLAMGLVGPAMIIGAAGLTAASIAIGSFSTALLGLAVSVPLALKSFDLIKQKAEEAKKWGSDLVQNFINGIFEKLGKLREMASKMAQTIKDYIHFTKPDKGPLSDADTYGSDFVKLFTSSAEGEFPKLKNMASDMGSILKDEVSGIDMSSIGESLGIDLGSGAESGLTPFLNKIKSELASVRNQYATISKNGNVNRGAMAGGPSLLTQKLVDERKAARDAANANNDYTSSTKGAGKGSSDASKEVDKLTNAFKTFEKGSKVSLGNMINSMAENYKATAEWARDVKTLMGKGFDKSITDWIQKMGVAGHETVKALMNASEEETAALNKAAKEYMTLDEDAKKYIEGDYEEFGTKISQALEGGLITYSTKLAETVQSALDPFGKFDNKVELTSAQMLANMQSQLDGIGTWSENLKKLMGRVPNSIIQYFQDLGPKSYEEVAAMANMTEEQLAQATELWNQQLEIGRNIAMDQANKYREVGHAITNGLSEGVDLTAVDATGTAIGDSVLNATKTTLGVHSPSTEYFAIGGFLPQGLGLGVKQNTFLATQALIAMAQQCKKVTYQILNEEAGEEIGMFFMRGLSRGILNGESSVIEDLKSMAQRVIAAAHAAFDEHSPSRIFETIGINLDRGLGQGIDKGTDAVLSATQNMADNTIQMMNDIIKNISAEVNDSPELQPVIRPRLDLTALQNGKSRIGSMLDNPAYEMATSVASNMVASTVNTPETPSQLGTTQNIIINQTNNSPKALDAYDIYRNTRNLVPQLQGVLS